MPMQQTACQAPSQMQLLPQPREDPQSWIFAGCCYDGQSASHRDSYNVVSKDKPKWAEQHEVNEQVFKSAYEITCQHPRRCHANTPPKTPCRPGWRSRWWWNPYWSGRRSEIEISVFRTKLKTVPLKLNMTKSMPLAKVEMLCTFRSLRKWSILLLVRTALRWRFAGMGEPRRTPSAGMERLRHMDSWTNRRLRYIITNAKISCEQQDFKEIN